jgi:hypothetical protein
MNAHHPPITDEIRQRAAQSPGSWIYSVDPGYHPDGEVPGYAVVGAWPVDEHGQPGTFVPNPNYRPSPAGMHLSAPTDEVDAAMQRAATGHGSDADVVGALAVTVVYLPANADGELIAYGAGSGTSVALFTDPTKAMSTAPQLLPLFIEGLLGQLPEHTTLVINPSNEVSVTMPSSELSDALRTYHADESRSAATTSTKSDQADAEPASESPEAGPRDDRRSDDDGVNGLSDAGR